MKQKFKKINMISSLCGPNMAIFMQKKNDDRNEKPFKILNKDIIDQIIENITQKNN
jgi:hypothetical protein